jgi:protein-tyrosine phosphatase
VSGGAFRAEVERDEDRLIVAWPPGEAVVVEVCATPERGTPILRLPVDRSGRSVIEGLDPNRRYYLHLRRGDADAVVVAERRVPLEGTLNFRDLGGYVGVDGRPVRWGRVYRSDHLGLLTDADMDRLVGLGVRTVVDFQGAHELRDGPAPPLPQASIRRLHRPISDGPADGVTFFDKVTQGTLTRFEVADLTAFYLRTLDRSAGVFGEVLRLAAAPDHHSLVFHCRAGKDRTGLTAALLLGALGVATDDIIDDYVLTNRFRSGRRMEVVRPQLAERGIDIDDLAPLFTAPADAMAGALAGLVADHGSIEAYLRAAAGLDDPSLDALRRHLLA